MAFHFDTSFLCKYGCKVKFRLASVRTYLKSKHIQGALRVIVCYILVVLIVIMTISSFWVLKAIISEKNSLIPKIIIALCIIGEFATIIFAAINDLL